MNKFYSRAVAAIFISLFIANRCLAAQPETESLNHACTTAQTHPRGYKCVETSLGWDCDGRATSMRIFENENECIIFTWHKTAEDIRRHCVPDPAENQPTCNNEARVKVFRRHNLAFESTVGMASTIESNDTLKADFEREYEACKIARNFCDFE